MAANAYGAAYPTLGVLLHWRTPREEAILLKYELARLNREVLALTTSTAQILRLPPPAPLDIASFHMREEEEARRLGPRADLILLREPRHDYRFPRGKVLPKYVPTISWSTGGIHAAIEQLEEMLWLSSSP